MEKFAGKFPKIDESQLLSDEEQNSVEGGACSESCKQACQPGYMNGSVDGPTIPVEVHLSAT